MQSQSRQNVVVIHILDYQIGQQGAGFIGAETSRKTPAHAYLNSPKEYEMQGQSSFAHDSSLPDGFDVLAFPLAHVALTGVKVGPDQHEWLGVELIFLVILGLDNLSQGLVGILIQFEFK